MTLPVDTAFAIGTAFCFFVMKRPETVNAVEVARNTS